MTIDISLFSGSFENQQLTRKSAIRAFCYSCMCGSPMEVEKCPSVKCALFPYRNAKHRPKGKIVSYGDYIAQIQKKPQGN